MTKVEELRTTITSELSAFYEDAHMDNPTREAALFVDSLIAAAIEQERERIRRMQLCGYRVQVSQFPDDERRHCRVETDVYGVAYTLVPASVLSPTEPEVKP